MNPFEHLPRCRFHIDGRRYGFGHIFKWNAEGEKVTIATDRGQIIQVHPNFVDRATGS
jgi:hypothetical protein